jgi:ankyrin repeat protein
MDMSLDALIGAIRSNSASNVRSVLDRHPELKARINDPLPDFEFDSPAMLGAVHRGNREMIEALLDAGADINARSRWWAGGFGALDGADPSLVPFLLEHGATLDVHSASRLGRMDTLQGMVSTNPELVHARGGDGQTPLHVASSVEVARFLVARGANVDARDIDHESTPAQYLIRDRQDVVRYLVTEGCQTDILMASALGDVALVREHLDRDPASIRTAVSERYFPKQNPRSGGTIYIWTLGANKTPHAVAREFGHDDVLRVLMDRSPASLQLALACELGDEARVANLLARHTDIVTSLPDEDRVRLAYAAQDENIRAVRLMLSAGWPLDVRGQHRATALHWAAFHGNADMARALIQYGAPVDIKGDDYDGTPLQWALHGSVHGWRCKTGDYAGTVESLLHAGAKAPEVTPDLVVSDAVREVLKRHTAHD